MEKNTSSLRLETEGPQAPRARGLKKKSARNDLRTRLGLQVTLERDAITRTSRMRYANAEVLSRVVR